MEYKRKTSTGNTGVIPMKFIVLLLFLTLLIPVVSATTRYVATNGNNNNQGTIDSPYLTIQYGVNQTLSGDTLFVRSGTYNERVVLYNTGSLNNQITISNYTGETPILDGSGMSYAYSDGLIEIDNINYTTINGFNITNAGGSGIHIVSNSTNITISNNSCMGTIYYACIRTGWFNYTYNITIKNNIIKRTNASGGIYSEQISLSGVQNGVVSSNELLYNFLGEDIVIKDNSTNIYVFGNHANDEGTKTSIYIGTAGQVPYAHDIYIYNNNISTSSNGNGIGMNTENGGHAENVSIYNNIITNSQNGIRFGYYALLPSVFSNVSIVNNVFRNNSIANIELGLDADENITDTVIRNNIFLANTAFVPWKHIYVRGVNINNLTVDNNLFNRSGQNVYTPCINCITADPLLDNVANNNYVLNISSPAINAGNYVASPNIDYYGNKRPSGSGVDIGIYEYPFWNISGYIYNFDGSTINNAKTYLGIPSNSTYINIATSSNGMYNFTSIAPGNYYIFSKLTNESSNKTGNVNLISDTVLNLTLVNYYNTTIISGTNIFINLSNTTNIEGDSLSYSVNRTDLFTDFNSLTGKGNWTPQTVGLYPIKFGVSNSVGFTNLTVLFNIISASITSSGSYVPGGYAGSGSTTTTSTDQAVPPSQEFGFRVTLDGRDVRIEVPDHDSPVTALNLYFKNNYYGEYHITIKKYPSYFSISSQPEFELKNTSSMDILSSIPIEVYQNQQKILSYKISSNMYRAQINSLGMFSVRSINISFIDVFTTSLSNILNPYQSLKNIIIQWDNEIYIKIKNVINYVLSLST